MRLSRAVVLPFAACALVACPDLSGFTGGDEDAGAPDAAADAPTPPIDAPTDAPVDASEAEAAPVDELVVDPPVNDPNEIVDLTARGSLDWLELHDPSTKGNRCATCAQLFQPVASNATMQYYSDDDRTWIWTNGSPVASATTHAGVYVENVASSIIVTAPTAATRRLLTLWIDTYDSGAKLQASIDGSSLAAQSVMFAELPNAVRYSVKIHFAASEGHTLVVSFAETSMMEIDGDLGNVAFSAMALAPDP